MLLSIQGSELSAFTMEFYLVAQLEKWQPLTPATASALRNGQKPVTQMSGKGLGFLPSRPCVWVQDTPGAVPVPNRPSSAHRVRTNYTSNGWGAYTCFVCPTGYPTLLEQPGASSPPSQLCEPCPPIQTKPLGHNTGTTFLAVQSNLCVIYCTLPRAFCLRASP